MTTGDFIVLPWIIIALVWFTLTGCAPTYELHAYDREAGHMRTFKMDGLETCETVAAALRRPDKKYGVARPAQCVDPRPPVRWTSAIRR